MVTRATEQLKCKSVRSKLGRKGAKAVGMSAKLRWLDGPCVVADISRQVLYTMQSF